MVAEDDDKPRGKISHDVGQDLSMLSAGEVEERIALLSAEIERLKADVAKKRSSRDAAAAFFKL